MSAAEAAALIRSGDQIGMSGFTGSGYPKAVPIDLARRITDANFRGQKFQVSVFTGASTGPELDGALAMAGGIHLRLSYQSDPETRKRINAGEIDYMVIHLSHCGAVRGVRISGQAGCGADRSYRTASLLLYALQTASTNLRMTDLKPFIHEVILDPRDVANTPLDSHI